MKELTLGLVLIIIGSLASFLVGMALLERIEQKERNRIHETYQHQIYPTPGERITF